MGDEEDEVSTGEYAFDDEEFEADNPAESTMVGSMPRLDLGIPDDDTVAGRRMPLPRNETDIEDESPRGRPRIRRNDPIIVDDSLISPIDEPFHELTVPPFHSPDAPPLEEGDFLGDERSDDAEAPASASRVAALERALGQAISAQRVAERRRDEAVAAERLAADQLRDARSSVPEVSPIEVKKERIAKEREVLQLRQALHEKEMDLLAFQDREAENETRRLGLEERLRESERERAGLLAEKSAADARFAELEQRAADAQKELKRRIGEQTMREADLEAQIQKLTSEVRAHAAEIDTLSEQLEMKEVALTRATERLTDLEVEGVSHADDLESLAAELEQSRAELSEHKRKVEELADRFDEAKAEREATARELAAERGKHKAARRSIDELREQIDEARGKLRTEARNRAKAMQALEVFNGILREAGFEREDDEQ